MRECNKPCSRNTGLCCFCCINRDECEENCGMGEDCEIRKHNIPKEDMVNHPSHYTNKKFECIEVIKEIVKGLNEYEAYITGTVLKYLWRWKFKNGLEDLKKARWYLDNLIQQKESEK